MTTSPDALRERSREHLELIRSEHDALAIEPGSLAELPPPDILDRLIAAGRPLRESAEAERTEATARADTLQSRGRIAMVGFGLCVAVALSGQFVPALDDLGIPAIILAVACYLVFRFGYVSRLKARRRAAENQQDVQFWDETLADWENRRKHMKGADETRALTTLEQALADAATRSRRLRS